jgi:nucleotide-binding universal stress UspA family protein
MSYRSILVHVDSSAQAAVRIRVAAQIALASGAHLIGAALTGVSRFLYYGTPSTDGDPHLALHLSFLRERANEALALFRSEALACALPSFEGLLIDDEPGSGLSLHARVADLVVLSHAEPHLPGMNAAGSPPTADFVPYVLLHAGRPVLLLPRQTQRLDLHGQMLVAWDASREAGRALDDSLPLLKDAARVRVAVFDDGAASRSLSEATTANPLSFLARHGIHATMEIHPAVARHSLLRRDAVGESLVTLVADSGVDVLVMGAYGHSRIRETILGGVTRTVYESMTFPVLMTH